MISKEEFENVIRAYGEKTFYIIRSNMGQRWYAATLKDIEDFLKEKRDKKREVIGWVPGGGEFYYFYKITIDSVNENGERIDGK